MDPDDKTTSTSVSAPADFDLGAINEAVAESAAHPTPVEDSPALANKALTMDEIADDSKFNDTGVDDDNDPISDVAVHPSSPASLGDSASPNIGADEPAEKAHEPEAAFIAGDIVDEKPEEEEESSEPKEVNPYENIGRDPLADDGSAPKAAAADADGDPDAKPAADSKPLEPVSLDNAITTGPVKKSNKGLIIGIVAGVVVIGIVVALIFILGKK